MPLTRAFSAIEPPATRVICGAIGVPTKVLPVTGTCTVRLIWLPLLKVLSVSTRTVALAKRATSAAPLPLPAAVGRAKLGAEV